MKLFLQILLTIFASLSLLLSLVPTYRLPAPTTPVHWAVKMFVSAPSPFLLLAALLITALAVALKFWPAVIISSGSVVMFLIHIIIITRSPQVGFGQAFGEQWESRIEAERKARFLPMRYVVRLPSSPDPVFQQNVLYYNIPETGRQLLCDVWQPPQNVKPSGLAFIYVHGSAWYYLEKDVGTRTFFRHLAAQGHVIMDISYRLYPETDFMGMVHDVKHAIAWMKTNAARYGVNPERVVIGGGSAGAHLSMLAAYTASNKQFTPDDLRDADIGVRGVISIYGPSDLRAHYFHAGHDIVAAEKQKQQGNKPPAAMPPFVRKMMGENYHRLGLDKDPEKGMVEVMLEGTPDEKPEVYALFSPVNHIHGSCPPSLLIQGGHDIITPVQAIREMCTRLQEKGVPVVMHILPQADHAFDLIQPKTNPAAHNCYYDVERFLALLV